MKHFHWTGWDEVAAPDGGTEQGKGTPPPSVNNGQSI